MIASLIIGIRIALAINPGESFDVTTSVAVSDCSFRKERLALFTRDSKSSCPFDGVTGCLHGGDDLDQFPRRKLKLSID